MVERFRENFYIVKEKLLIIGFRIDEERDYGVTFGNGTNWKILLNCDKYGKGCDILLLNISFNDIEISREGLSIYFILQVFGLDVLYKNIPLPKIMDFIIENKDKLFDETLPYKEAYDELNKIPD
ncbi:hypothetical protein [Sulfurimonas sp. CS5]|uniref:hypothetical protein n=1 Tax=Sulfurimonas sp. CS5 TaxID=3391145 RepID=UPI0039E922A7